MQDVAVWHIQNVESSQLLSWGARPRAESRRQKVKCSLSPYIKKWIQFVWST
jgi:hypothetical protein